MKNICVPVDFSESSATGLNYAVGLAAFLNAEITLLHIYSDKKSLVATRYKYEAELLEFAKMSSHNVNPNIFKTKFTYHAVNANSFIEGISNFLKESAMDFIVMGTKGASGAKEILLGSNSYNVILNVDVPVIIVPIDTIFQPLKNILFCSDYNFNEKIERLETITDLALAFNAEVRIAHVKTNGKEPSKQEHIIESKREDRFFGKEVIHSIKTIHDSDVLHGIQYYIQLKKDNDLVALIKRKKSYWDKVFKKSYTKKMALHSHLPLLVINE